MTMVLRVVGTMIAGWQVFGLSRAEGSEASERADRALQAPPNERDAALLSATQPAAVARRNVGIVAAAVTPDTQSVPAESVNHSTRTGKTIVTATTERSELPALRGASRSRGIGSRFRSQPVQSRGIVR
jgi:type IV secretion system protein VirB6